MSAILLWVRSVLRKHLAGTLAMALLGGVAAGVVGVAFQAARRADGSLARTLASDRSYDLLVFGCAPGFDPTADAVDGQQVYDQCQSLQAARQFRAEVVSAVPGVEASSVVGTNVVGILDPAARNGWGRLILVAGFAEDDTAGGLPRAVVRGRPVDEDAPDEVMIGETAAALAGIDVGDEITIASWSSDELDLAVDGRLPPSTPSFSSRVVGIVRTLADVQSSDEGGEGDLRGTSLPWGLFAGRAWRQAHDTDLAGYGNATVVRVAAEARIDAVLAAIEVQADASDRFMDSQPFDSDANVGAIQRVIDTERKAVLAFAAIAAVAGLALVGVMASRQLRTELVDARSLVAIGMSSRGLVVGAVLRLAVAAALACVVAEVVVVSASPLTPIGIARRLELSHPIRFDATVLTIVPLAVLILFTGVASVVTALRVSAARRERITGGTHHHGWLARWAARMGAVPRAGLGFTGGGPPRMAVAVGAVAVGFATGAACLVASIDRVVDHPVRYGAWWDVVVGQYSTPGPYADAVDRISKAAGVVSAAGVFEDAFTVTLDDVPVPYIAMMPLVGRPTVAIQDGRPPAAADEVALGAETARQLHKGLGDVVTLAIPEAREQFPDRQVRIVGIALMSNAVQSHNDLAVGVTLDSGLAERLNLASVPQSIVVQISPDADRQASIEVIVDQFPGSARLPTPSADLRNLERLRWVPWLIAALVALLALGSLVHALMTLLQRHARDLAVFAALGLTRRQRLAVGVVSGVVLTGLSGLVGAPGGVVLGRWIWRVQARRAGVPSGPVMMWSPTLLAVACALAVGAGVAAAAGRWVTRGSPVVQLRVE